MSQTPTVDATSAEITVIVQDEIPPLPPVTPDMVETLKTDGTPVVAAPVTAPVTFWGFLLGVVNTIAAIVVLVGGVIFLGAGAIILGVIGLVAFLVFAAVEGVQRAQRKAEFKKKHGMSVEQFRRVRGHMPRHL